MPIADPGLRDLFRAESDERLLRLDEVALRLDRGPVERDALDDAMRDAHSLKGAARMLGLGSIQALAHRLESHLNAVAAAGDAIEPGASAAIAADIATLRQRVAEATGVEPVADGPVAQAAGGTGDVAAAVPTNTLPEAARAPLGFQVESVRVDTYRLDALLVHAGELVVTRNRIAARLAELDRLASAVAQVSRQVPGAIVGAVDGIADEIVRLRGRHAEDAARLEVISAALEGGIRDIRLVPFSSLLRLFPRMVHDLARERGKEVELRIAGESTPADKRILEEMKDPLMHMLRNAIDHGVERPGDRVRSGKPAQATITLAIDQERDGLLISVADDGRGLDAGAIRATARRQGLATDEVLATMDAPALHAYILHPGFSTATQVTDVSGRGVGMDVVRAHVERLKGSLAIESTPGRGTRFVVRLPRTLATARVLVVGVAGHAYGLPIESVVVGRRVAASAMVTLEGRTMIVHAGLPVPVARLAALLQVPEVAMARTETDAPVDCVLLQVGGERMAVLVDAVIDELEIVLRPASALLGGVGVIAGVTILGNGQICTLLEPAELVAALPHASLRRAVDGGDADGSSGKRAPATAGAPGGGAEHRAGSRAAPQPKVVLLAEDSITTRAQEVRILEAAGYVVVTAADGLDALGKLAAHRVDALVSDINMPRMDGLELAARIRAMPQHAGLPIVLVTSLASDEDKRRGLEVGASAYIAKPEFDQGVLLECLERLIG